MSYLRNKNAFTSIEISAFFGQLALILKSGISVMEGLTIMGEDASDLDEQTFLTEVLYEFTQCNSLADALEKTGITPSYAVRMVRLGEETGTLDDVMDSLSQHYEREADIKHTIKASVTYPVVMGVMMIAVIIILLMKVLPIFNQVYTQLGSEMTGVSSGLMSISRVLNSYSKVFLIVLIIVVIALIVLCKTSAGQGLIRKIAYRSPFTRKTFEKMSACRFAGGLSIALAAGLPVDKAMELASSVNKDELFAAKLARAKKHMEEGLDLSSALMSAGILSGMYARMAAIGEKTGTMDQVMKHVAELYTEEVDDRINSTLAAIEPTLVIVLCLIVGLILLSVMLPLIGVMSGI